MKPLKHVGYAHLKQENQKHFIRIQSGPWKGTLIRFATPEQLKTVRKASQSYNLSTWKLLDTALCAQFPECLETK